MANKRVVKKYYEMRVYNDKEKLVDRSRLRTYPNEYVIRQLMEMCGGTHCTITDYYGIQLINKDPFICLSDISNEEDKWLYYKIWNPNIKDNIPYESCVEYPHNRLGVISIIKTASYNGLLVSFHSSNEKASEWANRYAWQYDCSPYDFSDEEEELEDIFL